MSLWSDGDVGECVFESERLRHFFVRALVDFVHQRVTVASEPPFRSRNSVNTTTYQPNHSAHQQGEAVVMTCYVTSARRTPRHLGSGLCARRGGTVDYGNEGVEGASDAFLTCV